MRHGCAHLRLPGAVEGRWRAHASCVRTGAQGGAHGGAQRPGCAWVSLSHLLLLLGHDLGLDEVHERARRVDRGLGVTLRTP